MKKFLLILISVFALYANAAEGSGARLCYLWGAIDNPSELKYAPLYYNQETGFFEGDVNIQGEFYVTTWASFETAGILFDRLFKLYGYVAWDNHMRNFPYSYNMRYPMRKLEDYQDNEVPWLKFNPVPGRYKVEINMNTKPETIALISLDSSVSDIYYGTKVEDVIYDLFGRRVKTIDQHGVYIINGKKVIR